MPIFNRIRRNENTFNPPPDGKIKRYVHSPLTVEHNGSNVEIKENGKVIISQEAGKEGDDILIDRVEVSASLIFKVASLLKATRKVKYIALSELKDYEDKSTNEELED